MLDYDYIYLYIYEKATLQAKAHILSYVILFGCVFMF